MKLLICGCAFGLDHGPVEVSAMQMWIIAMLRNPVVIVIRRKW